MNKMNDYQAAAQAAYEELQAAHADALAEAQARLQHATEAASADAIRPRLIAMLEQAEPPAADTVASVLGGYVALFPAHLQRDGALLIRSLGSTKKHHGLNDKQAGQIAAAIVACVHGKGSAGLIDFPSADTWHNNLSASDLHAWSGWVAPDAYEELQAELDGLTRERFEAERDLALLDASKQTLDRLAELHGGPARDVIRIKSNVANRSGVAGIFFEPGEVRELNPAQWGEIADHAGYRRMIGAGQLEVVA